MGSTALSIRQICASSLEERACVVALVNLCYRGKGNWTNEHGIVSGDRVTLEQLNDALQKFVVLVAVMHDTNRDCIIGCIKTGLVRDTVVGSLDETAGYVGMFGVHPEHGGKGIGNRLLRAAEQLCAARGALQMAMDVLSVRRDIITYYERKGYVVVANKSKPARPVIESAGERLLIESDFILMTKRLARPC